MRHPRPLLLVVALLVVTGCSKRVVKDTPTPTPGAADERIIEHTIGSGETLALIADNYYGDPARAADVARDNDLADPDRLTTGSVLRLTFSDAEWGEARRRAAALDPYNQGVALLEQERLAEAESRFRMAVQTAPELVAARYNLALVLVRRGNTAEAIGLLEQLTVERPEDLDFRFARGHALFQATRFDEAVTQFEMVLAVRPDHRRAAFGLARALEEAGRPETAEAAWERYLEVDPDSGWAAQARRRLQALRSGE